MPDPSSTAPTAPATPAPAPAKPAAAPPTPAKPEATPTASTGMEDAYKEFDEIDKAAKAAGPKKEAGKTAPPTVGKEKSAVAVPSVAKEVAAVSDGKEASTATPAGEATATPTEAPKPKGLRELGLAYDTLKKNTARVQADYAALKSEHEKLKAAKAEDPEKPKLVEAISAKDKRIAELEQELKFRAYESTDEYRKSYQQPFEDAYTSGRSAAAELTVTLADGTERQGTAQDFDRVMSATNAKDASALARSLFGEDALVIISHANEVRRLYQAGQRAIQEYRSKGAEREKMTAAEQAKAEEARQQSHKEVSGIYTESVAEAVKKYPQWFAPSEGETADAASNELLAKGMELADIAFNPPPNMAPQKLAKIHSVIRNKAGAFDRVVHDYKARVATLEAKIADLETQLKEFDSSVPGEDGGRRGPEKKPLTANEEIDALDTARR